MLSKKFKRVAERRIILHLLKIRKDELDYLLFLFRKVQKRYKRDIFEDVMDVVYNHDDIREDFAESVFYYILYEIIVEINKKYDIEISSVNMLFNEFDRNNLSFSFGLKNLFLDDCGLTEKEEGQIIREFRYWNKKLKATRGSSESLPDYE